MGVDMKGDGLGWVPQVASLLSSVVFCDCVFGRRS